MPCGPKDGHFGFRSPEIQLRKLKHPFPNQLPVLFLGRLKTNRKNAALKGWNNHAQAISSALAGTDLVALKREHSNIKYKTVY